MASVSEVARDMQRNHAVAIPSSIPDEQHAGLLEQVTVMQGSIWQYSDSQPWFLVGLHKNNPTATREALESIMRLRIEDEDLKKPLQPHQQKREKRKGTVILTKDDKLDLTNTSLCDSQGRKVPATVAVEDQQDQQKAMARYGSGDELVPGLMMMDEQVGTDSTRLTSDLIDDLYQTGKKRFSGTPETKIVIKKTVELIGDMSKSCELVFHAVRACARFLTYPTPSVPSDNVCFGHIRGWIWLIYKGLTHFNHNVADKHCIDTAMKTFRKEMSLLAKEANGCIAYLHDYLNDLGKLTIAIKKEALLLKKKHKHVCAAQMDRYFRFVDEIRQKRQLLVDITEDRFFPTDWLFEPHPQETKLQWDFFHFQWINMSRDWIESEFELRSDYSLHWKKFTAFPPEHQTDIIVHLIHHVKALIEECHHFHQENFHLSFDSQEIKFLKFSLEEVAKLKRHREAMVFITSITKKLFEDLAVLQRISEDYVSNMEWVVTIIEPCYNTIDTWVAEDLILPLEYHSKVRNTRSCWLSCFGGSCFGRKDDFLEMFGDPMKVILMRTPISIPKLDKYFPPEERIAEDVVLPSADINAFGLSTFYQSSIFDSSLGRDQPLPLTHPLPKYKKGKPTFNIFDIHRLIETTSNCVFRTTAASTNFDIDTEKYLELVEEVQRFLAAFATIFQYITADLKERVDILESLMYSNLPEHYGSLEKMIAYEKLRLWETLEKSGTKAVGRLNRIFQFCVYFLEKVNTLEDGETTFYAAKQAYYRSYGKTQSWIYQKAAVFSMYALPHKVDMFNCLFTEQERPAAGMNIREFVEQGNKLIDICEAIFKSNGIVIP